MNAVMQRDTDTADAAAFGRILKRDDRGSGAEPRRFVAMANRVGDPVYTWEEIARRLTAITARDRSDRVYLYRHGATNYNKRNLVSGQHDTVLSEEGREQAARLRRALPGQIDLIVCSALFRAVETMEISTSASIRAHAPVLIDARLNEVNLGVLQGRRRRYLPEFDAGDLDFAPPEGETYRTAARRVFSSLVDIVDRLAARGPSPRHAAVFCHAGVLRIIATLTEGRGDPKEVFEKSLGNTDCLSVDTRRARLPDYWVGDENAGARHTERHQVGRG